MPKRKKGQPVNGWVNLDKPYEMTSTQAVAGVKRLLNAQKAGHAGTLDPLATGILPIALGAATKTVPYVQDALKVYSFTVKWGEETDTDDAEGEIVETATGRPDQEAIKAIIEQFTGEIEQIPPQYSALKKDGRRAYDLARAGESVELEARPVYIERLELKGTEADEASFWCRCGKGTYIRSLARDMARALGTVGHITKLRREVVGPFTEEDAISLEKLEQISHSAPPDELVLPVSTALDGLPVLILEEPEVARIRNGQSVLLGSRPALERLKEAGLGPDCESAAEALAVYKGADIAIVNVDGVSVRSIRLLN